MGKYWFPILFFTGSFFIFFYLWMRGRLDMGETPKYQMFEIDEDKPITPKEGKHVK